MRQTFMLNRMTRLIGATALVLMVSAIGPIAQVYACSCMILGPGDALANADVAFVGVVARIDDPTAAPVVSSGDPVFYTFAVEEPLKGEPGAQLVVSSSRDSASCGVTFNVAERWRVYANADGEGGVVTGSCSGNELIATGVEIPEIAAPEPAPPPFAVFVAGGAILAVIAVSAFAFMRPSRKAEDA